MTTLTDADKLTGLHADPPADAPPKRGAPRGPRKKKPAPAPMSPSMISPEEAEGMGKTVQGLFAGISGQRKKTCKPCGGAWAMPDEMVTPVGEAVVRVMRKHETSLEEKPEMLLLLVLAPFVVNAIRTEVEWFLANRRSRAETRQGASPPAGVEGRRVRPVGVGENDAHPGFVTAPFTGLGG